MTASPRFLGTPATIRGAVGDLARSKRLDLAVGFIGQDWRDVVADFRGTLRVVCWLSSTNTNPRAVRQMLAAGVRVRQRDGMHAKVYYGPGVGAVVGSANLSRPALDDADVAGPARVLPATFIVDPEGKVRYSYYGAIDWSRPDVRAAIAKLISYLILAVLATNLSNRFVKLPIAWRALGKYLLAGAIMYVVAAAVHPFYTATVREFRAAGRAVVGSGPVGVEGTSDWMDAIARAASVPAEKLDAAKARILPAIRGAMGASPVKARVTVSGYEGSELLVARLLPFLLVAPLAGVFVDRWDRRRTMVGANLAMAVAVLPFRNLGPDRMADFLGLALPDEIVTTLSYARPLAVRPFAATQKYATGDSDPQAAGRELRVAAVVTGHYLREGDRLRVTMEAIDVESNRLLWRGTVSAMAHCGQPGTLPHAGHCTNVAKPRRLSSRMTCSPRSSTMSRGQLTGTVRANVAPGAKAYTFSAGVGFSGTGAGAGGASGAGGCTSWGTDQVERSSGMGGTGGGGSSWAQPRRMVTMTSSSPATTPNA